jgi:hypothetical protein
MTMYVFLFVLVPLAIVIAWALAQDWKHRHRRHAHRADTQSRIMTATESAKGRATKWMLRVTQDEQAGLTDCLLIKTQPARPGATRGLHIRIRTDLPHELADDGIAMTPLADAAGPPAIGKRDIELL